jgi:hypothetical protein
MQQIRTGFNKFRCKYTVGKNSSIVFQLERSIRYYHASLRNSTLNILICRQPPFTAPFSSKARGDHSGLSWTYIFIHHISRPQPFSIHLCEFLVLMHSCIASIFRCAAAKCRPGLTGKHLAAPIVYKATATLISFGSWGNIPRSPHS